jgi:hypothetical protein
MCFILKEHLFHHIEYKYPKTHPTAHFEIAQTLYKLDKLAPAPELPFPSHLDNPTKSQIYKGQAIEARTTILPSRTSPSICHNGYDFTRA